jgi:hypothetical protein
MAHHTAHDNLERVEHNEESIHLFSKSLDDWDVPSLCQVSGVRISGRQIFPHEEISQAKKMFYVRFTKTVTRTKLQLVNESLVGTDVLSDGFIYLYFGLLKWQSNHPKAQSQAAESCVIFVTTNEVMEKF